MPRYSKAHPKNYLCDCNNSLRFLHHNNITTNRDTFLNYSRSPSSDSTSSFISLTSTPAPSYHDYTFNTQKTSTKTPTPPIILSLQDLRTPTKTIHQSLSINRTHRWGNNKTKTTPIPNSPIIEVPPIYNSDPSQDDD